MLGNFPSRSFIVKGLLAGAAIALAAPVCFASAFVGGAYYQLGDADPGAAAGQPGNSITQDSLSGDQDLSRLETPKYSSDVPALGPVGDKLSMQFANIGLGGPTIPGSYGREKPVDASQQGVVLEAWAKLGPFNLDAPTFTGTMIVAFDQGPDIGLFVHDDDYVARFGAAEFKLGPAEVGAWHHLAYVKNFNVHSFYYDGQLISSVVQDPPAPGGTPSTGGFWVGGMNGGPGPANADLLGSTVEGFNGWIDEVRLQTFNPLAAGAFEPTAFLISPAPEPAACSLLAFATSSLVIRRRRRTAADRL